jgi:membrane peptidoglycan carboxypeptidase
MTTTQNVTVTVMTVIIMIMDTTVSTTTTRTVVVVVVGVSSTMVLLTHLRPIAGARLVSEPRALNEIMKRTKRFGSDRPSPSTTSPSPTFRRKHGGYTRAAAPLPFREARRRRVDDDFSRRRQHASTRVGGMVVGGMAVAAGGISAVIMAQV